MAICHCMPSLTSHCLTSSYSASPGLHVVELVAHVLLVELTALHAVRSSAPSTSSRSWWGR
eukprot:9357638-Heterocapsa_arctica.AAC.1